MNRFNMFFYFEDPDIHKDTNGVEGGRVIHTLKK